MPTLPIYIRVDDLEKWKALPNKAEFIHNALKELGAPAPAPPKETKPKRVLMK